MIRKHLFLDIDGVLHSETSPKLAMLGLLEQCLLHMPGLEVVISSTWRKDYPLPALRGLFRAELQPQIVGVTPELDSFVAGGRQREIEAYLAALPAAQHHWIALDDWRELFDPACPHLLWVDPQIGFSAQHQAGLLAWWHRLAD